MPRVLLRIASVVLGGAAVTAGTAGCGPDPASTQAAVVVDLAADQVSSVTFTADGQSAAFQGLDGNFEAVAGGTPEAATQLTLAAGRLFPLNGYRSLPAADTAEPAYGLAGVGAAPDRLAPECGSGCSMAVSDHAGTTTRVVIGARSFNGAGFYAAVEGRPGVHLVIARSVSDIITFAKGKPFEFPPTARAAGVDRAIDALGADGPERDPDTDRHPFLRQRLAAEADRKAAAAGRPGGNLVRAATSTTGQAGAPARSGGRER